MRINENAREYRRDSYSVIKTKRRKVILQKLLNMFLAKDKKDLSAEEEEMSAHFPHEK